MDFNGVNGFIQLQLGDLVTADHVEWQRERENQPWIGMKTGRAAYRQGGAAEHALKAAHQIVMADQAKVAAFLESEADFVKRHAGASHSGPRRSCGAGQTEAAITRPPRRRCRSGSLRFQTSTLSA